MSQSSETVTHSDYDLLGYPNQSYSNGYYTAQVRPGIGICLANMQGGTMLQFFPWEGVGVHGHDFYAKFITSKAADALAENGELFNKWPFLHTETSELLIIKCMVEDGLNQVEKSNEQVQRGGADASTGKALE